jgi:hypothetical protein
MKTIVISIFFIITGTATIWETLFRKPPKGFVVDSMFNFILMLFNVLYPVVLFGLFTTTAGDIEFVLFFLISIIIFDLYVIGFRISFKSNTRIIVEEKLQEVLKENNIKYIIDDSKDTYKIIIRKYFCSICIQSMFWNTEKRTVAFKGWLNYKSYRQIRDLLIGKLENEVIVKKSDIIYDILSVIIGIGFIGIGIWIFWQQKR